LGADTTLGLVSKKFSPMRAAQRVRAIDFDKDGRKDDLLHLVPNAAGRIVGVAILPTDTADLVSARPSTGSTFIDPETITAADARVVSVTAATPTTCRVVLFVGGSRFISFHQEVAKGDDTGIKVSFSGGVAYGDVGLGDNGAGGALTGANHDDIVISPGVAGTPNDEKGLFVIYSNGGNLWSRAIQILGPAASPGRSGTFANAVGGFADVDLADFNNNGELSIYGIPVEDGNPPDVSGVSKNSLVILDRNADDIGLTAFFDFDPGNNGLVFVSVGVDAANFTADTFRDIVLASNLGPTCNVMVNKGAAGLRNGGLSATFTQPPTTLPSDPRPVEARVADLDGDGKVDDIAMTTLGVGALMVYTSNGDGTFNKERDLLTAEPFWCATGDFNGDGRQDVVSSARGSGTLSVFFHK